MAEVVLCIVNARRLHDQQRESNIWYLEFPQKASESFVVRLPHCLAGEGGGQNRKIGSSHGIESREKSGYKLDVGFVQW
jgi:hypothetical protein